MASTSILIAHINTVTQKYYIYNYTPQFTPKIQTRPRILNYPITLSLQSSSTRRYVQLSTSNGEEEEMMQDLRVPQQWLEPSKAAEESEWLRVTLHKWLDDEYCPEPTNVDISRIAAQSYYESLVEKETDLGDILLKMALELESISYQESFHGAFSSANAAINLIIQKIEQVD